MRGPFPPSLFPNAHHRHPHTTSQPDWPRGDRRSSSHQSSAPCARLPEFVMSIDGTGVSSCSRPRLGTPLTSAGSGPAFRSRWPSPSVHGLSLSSSVRCSVSCVPCPTAFFRPRHLLRRTVPQRAADRAILYRYLVIPELLPANIGTWFKSELDPNVQFFVSPCSAWGCLPPPAYASRCAPPSSPCRAARKPPGWRWA